MLTCEQCAVFPHVVLPWTMIVSATSFPFKFIVNLYHEAHISIIKKLASGEISEILFAVANGVCQCMFD